MLERLNTDILILGSGGAGLFAALHAHQANPALQVTVATKGLLGKCGCTRMVQGGYNVALNPGDSVERHFMDTIEGGKWLPNQEMAWTLVTKAIERVHELENEIGCFFDRNADGTLHGKAFAGQTFDRTVHKGDLTGIEIINRLMEQVWARPIRRLEEHRAVALIPARDGQSLAGVPDDRRAHRALPLRRGQGGAAGHRRRAHHVPLPHALRRQEHGRPRHGAAAGAAPARHGDGAVPPHRPAGGPRHAHDRHGAGGGPARLRRASAQRPGRALHGRLRPARRAGHARFRLALHLRGDAGRPHHAATAACYIKMSHLGPERVRKQFKGMVERCADCGFDLAGGLVEVVPTAHYFMGGVVCGVDTSTELPGLFVAGEDAGGAHGANRLGGNGVANSTVFGGIAGETMAAWLAHEPGPSRAGRGRAGAPRWRARSMPFARKAGDLNGLRERLLDAMWDDVGVMRDAAGLKRGLDKLDAIEGELLSIGVADGDRAFNLTWHDWLNLRSLVEISKVITLAALRRENSRGAHYREDFPGEGDLATSTFTVARQRGGMLDIADEPVQFTIVRPGETLLKEAAE